MCGRYTLNIAGKEISQHFDLDDQPTFDFRYNIAPSQDVLIIRQRDSGRFASMAHWGLIPHWAKDKKIGYKMINARSETLDSKPSFCSPFHRQRCIIPAGGFYEWKKTDNSKQPYYIFRTDGCPLGLAGLWERWANPDQPEETLESFTIITTDANDQVGQLHDRMPAILEPEEFGAWLDPHQTDPKQLHTLMHPAAEGVLDMYPISTYVNSPSHEGPNCIKREQEG